MQSNVQRRNLSSTIYLQRTKLAALALVPALIFAMALVPSAQAQSPAPKFTYYSFHRVDGANPFVGLIEDGERNFYGTTSEGGTGNGGLGYGTVFKIAAPHNETVLYQFTGGADGDYPYGRLVGDPAGNLYGTTQFGGDPSCSCGVVFKLDPAGNLTVLHAFTGGDDGYFPLGGLIRDQQGNLYGTTVQGGTHDAGTVFKLYPNGGLIMRYSFAGPPSDGAYPISELVRDGAGNIYGITQGGGTAGLGTVFKIDTSGTETLLHSFAGAPDGSVPTGTLTRDASGNFYGTTAGGGRHDLGAVFILDASGKESVFYSFNGADGAAPQGGVVEDSAGNLYGTTFGGAFGCGVVFRLDPAGKENLLHKFSVDESTGCGPLGGLVLDHGGHLFGTTSSGGLNGNGNSGTVFRVSATR